MEAWAIEYKGLMPEPPAIRPILVFLCINGLLNRVKSPNPRYLIVPESGASHKIESPTFTLSSRCYVNVPYPYQSPRDFL